MLVGLILQGLGLGLFGYSESLSVNLMIFVVLGLGQGAVEVTTNVSVVSIETPGKSRLMNLVHSAFTIGAMAAPFLAGLSCLVGYFMACCLYLYVIVLFPHADLDMAGSLAP
jgi:fucose permease